MIRKPSNTVWRIRVDPCTGINESDYLLQMPWPDGHLPLRVFNSGFPLTIGRVCQLAFQYANVNGIMGFSNERQMAGHKWLSGFLKRHPDISLKKASYLSHC